MSDKRVVDDMLTPDDQIEGALSAAFVDVGLTMAPGPWVRLCAALSRQARRRGLIR